MKNVEFCRKTSKFLPARCLLIFCIFYLNEKEREEQKQSNFKNISKTITNSKIIISKIITFTTCGQTLTKI